MDATLLPPPSGISVAAAARLLQVSQDTVLRMVREGVIVGWKPGGPKSRKYLIDEVTLALIQKYHIQQARAAVLPAYPGIFAATSRRA